MADPTQVNSMQIPLPPQYMGQVDEALRQKLLAQAILTQLQKANSGTEMLGGVAVRKSPISGVADAISSMLANRQIQGADAQIQNAQQGFLDSESQAVQKMQGFPDLQQRIDFGMSSQSPAARKLAEALLKQKGEMANTWMKAVSETDPTAAAGVARTGQVPADFQLTPPKPLQDAVLTGPDGKQIPYVVSTNRKQEQQPHFPPQGTNVNVDMGQRKAALEAAGKDVPELFKAAQGKVEQGSDLLQRGKTLAELATDPQLIAGTGGNIQLFLSGLGAKLGLNPSEAATKTQALIRGLAQSVLDNSKELKGSISDKDIQFMAQISSGSIELTPETLRDATNIMQAAGFNLVQRGIQSYVGVRDATPDGTNQQISAQYPLPMFSATAPQGKGFQTVEAGKDYQKSIYSPAQANTPAKAPANGQRLDPNKVYTLEELRKLGVKF